MTNSLYDIRLNGKSVDLASTRTVADHLIIELQKKLGGSWRRTHTSLELPRLEQVDQNGDVLVVLDMKHRVVSSSVLPVYRSN